MHKVSVALQPSRAAVRSRTWTNSRHKTVRRACTANQVGGEAVPLAQSPVLCTPVCTLHATHALAECVSCRSQLYTSYLKTSLPLTQHGARSMIALLSVKVYTRASRRSTWARSSLPTAKSFMGTSGRNS